MALTGRPNPIGRIRPMKRHAKCLWKVFVMIPMLGLYNLASCQADTLRNVARDLDERANKIDGEEDDLDLGDYLADLVDGL